MYDASRVLDIQQRHFDEVERQEVKWGVQTHPDGCTSEIFGKLETAFRELTDLADEAGELTWALIMLEEVYEALATDNVQDRLDEIDQIAAVATSWARDIETR
jgi:hypothetical protein